MLYGADTLLSGSNAVWGADNHRWAMRQASAYRTTISDHSDIYGSGKLISLRARYASQQVEQRIYIYADKPYLHTELEVSAPDGVALNYMAPVSISQPYALFNERSREGLYSLFIPFDNDAFVRYRSIEFGKPTESYGVTAFFDGGSRQGLVIGAVEHTDEIGIGHIVKGCDQHTYDAGNCQSADETAYGRFGHFAVFGFLLIHKITFLS